MKGGILKAKATAHANFMATKGLHRKHLFWGGFENFKGMKKKPWLPTFTQLSPKKEIAKNKPNTPKVLFNNKRTLYEQDWCIKESHQFSQPPAKNIPLD